MKICIVMPMHNEEAIAKKSIKLVCDYLKYLPAGSMLLVVDDGSTDKTSDILKNQMIEFDKQGFLKSVRHPANLGYGAAIKTGAKFAAENGFDYLLFMDSDLTNHPKYLKAFYGKMLEGWDYIKASRYAKGGGAEGVPQHRRIISFLGNKVAKILFGLPLADLTNGFRAVKTGLFSKFDLRESGFAIIMEELCEAKRFTNSFSEFPYILTNRAAYQGKTHFTYSSALFFRYLKYALKGLFSKRII